MKNPLLSVCIIAKNEEVRLPLLLKDLKSFADEIIVVDTGSTDATVSIAESNGARVVKFAWCDDFSAARNESLSAANGSWILWLDADDRVSLDDGNSIKALVERSKPDEAYTVEIINTSLDGRPSSFLQLRIFPNDSRLRFQGRIHESVAGAAKMHKFNVKPSCIKVIHTGYETAAARKQKMERNMSLLLRELDKDPDNIAHRFLLAGSLAMDGKSEEALVQYERICSTRGAMELQADVFVRSLIALAKWNTQSGRFAAGEQWARRAVSARESDMEAQYELARALAGRGELYSALAAVNAGLKCDPYISSVVIDFISVRAALYELILQLLHHSQKHLEAGEWLRKGIEELPYSPEMVRVAAQYYTLIKRADLAQTVYKYAINRMPELKNRFEEAIKEIVQSLKSTETVIFHPEFLRTLPSEKMNNVLVYGFVDSVLYSALKDRGAYRIDGISGGSLCSTEFVNYREVEKSGVKYDSVIFGNALETMESPIEELKYISHYMTQNGTAYFTVRNLQHYSVFSSISYGLLNSAVSNHNNGRMFTKDSAISMIEKGGFKTGTVIELLDPVYQQQIVKQSATSMNLGKSLLDLEGLNGQLAKDFFAISYFFHTQLISSIDKITEGMNLSVTPSNVRARNIEDEGRRLLEEGKYNEAASFFLNLIELQPEKALGYTYLGLSEWYQGRFTDAYFLFKNAASLEPNDADVLINLWDAALKTGNTVEASRILQKSLVNNPELIEIKEILEKQQKNSN
jgi:tetratricopeptide (TPR) repeat protein